MKRYDNPLTLIRILSDYCYHSGQKLGETLGVSRVTINHYIQQLKSWGIEVCSIPNRGYRLLYPIQLLDKEAITAQLGEQHVHLIPVIDSTNQYLLEHITTLSSGDICVAEYQSIGRGRRGRQWFSPFGTNLYYSMYWCLENGMSAIMGLSIVIGITVVEVLTKFSGNAVKLKWPNDIYLNDKKLAGILVELNGQVGDVTHVVLGIGINLFMRQVEPSIVTQLWANLENQLIDRNQLVITLTQHLKKALQLFEQQGLEPFINKWQALDNFINQPVRLISGNKIITGINRGIDLQGAILLEQNGIIIPYIGNEISLRGQETQ